MKEKSTNLFRKDFDSLTNSEKALIKKILRCRFFMESNINITPEMLYNGYCILKRSLLLKEGKMEMVTIYPQKIIRNYGVFGGGTIEDIAIIHKKTFNGLYSDECGHLTIGPNPADFPVIDVSYKTEKLTILTLMDTRNGQLFRITSEEASFDI